MFVVIQLVGPDKDLQVWERLALKTNQGELEIKACFPAPQSQELRVVKAYRIAGQPDDNGRKCARMMASM